MSRSVLPPGPVPIWFSTLSLILLLGVWGLGYATDQSDFGRIALFYGLAFGAYFMVLARPEWLRYWRYWLVVGAMLRVILLFGMPTLSDDVYRFLWDGYLLRQGLNPFSELPGFYMEPGNEIPGLDPALFDRLNSQEYFTVYPPLAQVSFGLAVSLFPNSWLGAIMVLKVWLLIFELGNLWLIPRLMARLGLPRSRVLIYALNPLVIVEGVGNLHYEVMMVFFLLLAIYGILQARWVLGAVFFAASIASKLLTVLFLPFFWSRMSRRRLLYFYSLVIGLTLLFFLPLLGWDFFAGFGSSLELYFRKFEFNASLYYLIRWVGYQLAGYNIIQMVGPRLGLLAVVIIGIMGLRDQGRDYHNLFGRMLGAICLYLFLATTVHPWYSILPLALCMFTNWRFPLIWTAVIWLTYINYSGEIYRENLWIVALEYMAVLAWAAWEYYRRRRLRTDAVLLFARAPR